jgi:hypothetical protein
LFVRIGDGQRQRAPSRSRAHRREIAEVYCQNSITDRVGRGSFWKVDSIDQRIRRDRQWPGCVYDCRIVADP